MGYCVLDECSERKIEKGDLLEEKQRYNQILYKSGRFIKKIQSLLNRGGIL